MRSVCTENATFSGISRNKKNIVLFFYFEESHSLPVKLIFQNNGMIMLGYCFFKVVLTTNSSQVKYRRDDIGMLESFLGQQSAVLTVDCVWSQIRMVVLG